LIKISDRSQNLATISLNAIYYEYSNESQLSMLCSLYIPWLIHCYVRVPLAYDLNLLYRYLWPVQDASISLLKEPQLLCGRSNSFCDPTCARSQCIQMQTFTIYTILPCPIQSYHTKHLRHGNRNVIATTSGYPEQLPRRWHSKTR
jgi:hypothetical protein